jgi:predicted nuclease with TOPRIM domain
MMNEVGERIQKIRAKFEDAVKENRELSNRLSEREAEVQQLNAQKVELEKKADGLVRENGELKSRIEEIESRYNELVTLVNDLSTQMDQLKDLPL